MLIKMNRVVAAAMSDDYNYGNPTEYPAAFGQGIIAVGATTDNDVRSDFSGTGNYISVVAPGGINIYPNTNQHDIFSTWGPNPSSYLYLAGTSMATPIASGISSLRSVLRRYLYSSLISFFFCEKSRTSQGHSLSSILNTIKST
ncbi:MAG: S8 family serine peptidase [Bacteroidota bacterium]|nr:S8 family serine peptidase [Bacteroidota bacterium]